MSWYKFYQVTGGDETWSICLAEHADQIIKDKQPAFMTALSCDNTFQEALTAEQIANVSYQGDFYTDFDASSLEEVIPMFQAFTKKLVSEYGINLNQVKMYASGGKGFHLTIPVECFITKPSRNGYKRLPAIYKEMAMEMYVNTLDMRVYTARRGRQFRVENVERPDKPGIHKVRLLPSEVEEMTPELYRELVVTPRTLPAAEPPTLSPTLAMCFSSCLDKVEAGAKRGNRSKADAELIRKFKGEFPETIQKVMQGEHIDADVGFQKIATQLALAAHALGKSESDFLTACEGLCEKHRSDGIRYNSPDKRRRELSRMYEYMRDNVCYEFSIGGIKSLLTEGTETKDLDSGGANLGEVLNTVEEAEGNLTLGMSVSSTGIWKRGESGFERISAIGFTNPVMMVEKVESNETIIGYQVECFFDGHSTGRHLLTMDLFKSRSQFLGFVLAVAGVSIQANDMQISALADIFRRSAMQKNQVVYVTPREGLDVTITADGNIETIWVDGEGVLTAPDSTTLYTFRNAVSRNSTPTYRTDLRTAEKLEDTDLSRRFFDSLFYINKPTTLGKMLGWFTACYPSQIIRTKLGKFPVLHVEGQAGAGKTTTTMLLSRLHYHNVIPRLFTSGLDTKFAWMMRISSSASIPILMDEFKPSEMGKERTEYLRQIIRANYDGAALERGAVNSDSGQSKLELRGVMNVAPLVILGEAVEDQTAIVERYVHVPMSKDDRVTASEHYLEFCVKHSNVLSSLGKQIMLSFIGADLDLVSSQVTQKVQELRTLLPDAKGMDRSIYNVAVMLYGLDVFKENLHKVFGDRYDAAVDNLIQALLDMGKTILPQTRSELDDVLDDMALLSGETDPSKFHRLIAGEHFLVVGNDLHLKYLQAFYNYREYRGNQARFDGVDKKFFNQLRNKPYVKEVSAFDSPLKKAFADEVVVLDIEMMQKYGLKQFGSLNG